MNEQKPSLAKIYWILMKPRVVFLLQATAICGILTYDFREGYDNGRTYIDSLTTALIVLLGGSLASGGSMTINMWYERDIDPLMERTLNRPIPSHQRVSNKSSNIHRRMENQTHRVLNRNRPVASATASTGKGFGSDLYANGSREMKLLRKIRPGGMPGKATAPRHSLTRHTQFKTNPNKMNLIHKSSATLGGRY